MKKYKKQIIIFFCCVIASLLTIFGIWFCAMKYQLGLSVSPEIQNMQPNTSSISFICLSPLP